MDIQELGALGEFVSSIAVVTTMIFLAIQIRQNTKTVQAEALNGALRESHQLVNNNERYIRLLISTMDGAVTSFEDNCHMVERFSLIMRSFQNSWYQSKEQSLDIEFLDSLRWALSIPVTRGMWDRIEGRWNKEFRELVQREVLAVSAPNSSLSDALDYLSDISVLDSKEDTNKVT